MSGRFHLVELNEQLQQMHNDHYLNISSPLI